MAYETGETSHDIDVIGLATHLGSHMIRVAEQRDDPTAVEHARFMAEELLSTAYLGQTMILNTQRTSTDQNQAN